MQALGSASLTTGIVLVAVSIPLLVLGSLSLDEVLPDSKDTQSTFSTYRTSGRAYGTASPSRSTHSAQVIVRAP